MITGNPNFVVLLESDFAIGFGFVGECGDLLVAVLSPVIVDVVEGVEEVSRVPAAHLHQLEPHATDLATEGADEVIAPGQHLNVDDHPVEGGVGVATVHLSGLSNTGIPEDLVIGESENVSLKK